MIMTIVWPTVAAGGSTVILRKLFDAEANKFWCSNHEENPN